MTSVSLFFKMVGKDIRRRIWCPVAIAVAFFLAMEVDFLISLQQLRTGREEKGIIKILEQNYLSNQFLTPDYGSIVVVLMIVAAICCGISGFSYLNSKKQIDMYHSLPIRREMLFAVRYVSGIICFMIPFLLNLVLTMIMAGVRGIITGQAIVNMLGFIVYQLIYFLSIYTVVIIAVILTGNLVLNFIASAVLLFYDFLFWAVYSLLCSTFLKTYTSFFEKLFWVMSPIRAMVNSDSKIKEFRAVNAVFSYKAVAADMLWMLPVIAVLIVIAIFLVQRRPSEAAEKSIAFKVSEPIIKTLTLIPASIMCASLFYEIAMQNDFGWFIFGGVFGFLLVGLMMEMIFRQDFKGAFCHWRQLVVNLAVLIVIVLCWSLDVFGFDTYLPDKDKLSNMAISIDNMDNNITYTDNGIYRISEVYRLNHMEITDMEAVYALAAIATDNVLDYSDMVDADIDRYIPLTVAYRLQNGREVYREYCVDSTDEKVMSLLNDVYTSKEYKYANFPALTQYDDSYYQIRCTASFDSGYVRLNQEKREEFFQIYSKDLETLTLNQICTEYPVGSISFDIHSVQDETEYSYYDNFMGYPIYPGFQATIDWFAENGFEFDKTVDINDIIQVMVWDYSTEPVGNEYEHPHVQYEDPAIIQEILENTASTFELYNSFYMPLDDEMSVDVNYNTPDGSVAAYFYFKKDAVPDTVQKDLEAFVPEEESEMDINTMEK